MRALPARFVAFLLPLVACAQVQIGPASRPQVVFSGGQSSVSVPMTNLSGQRVEAALSVRILQIAGTVIAPLGGSEPWKKTELQPGQTVLDKLRIVLPAVRVATRFRVEILDEAKLAIGRVEVIGCPPDLLKRLGELGGVRGPAVYDPGQLLAPALRAAGVSFVEMNGAEALADFAGRLVVADLSGKDATLDGWRAAAAAAAKRGMSVVLLLPTDGAARAAGLIELDGYVTIVASGAGRIAMLHRASVDSFSTSAAAQIALVQLAESLVHPPPSEFPDAP